MHRLITTREELFVILSERSEREDPDCQKLHSKLDCHAAPRLAMTSRTKRNDVDETLQAGSIGLVPTMGALHKGHLSLVDIAEKHADITIVTIFVNPLQFGPNEDFSKYPRTLEKDLELLASKKVDYIFAPSAEELFAIEPKKIQANPEIANRLCGLERPGHFDGVCTIVNLFFELIKPDLAVFGEKDFQQFMIIQDMVKQLKLPIEIIPAPIVREDNGLAMSSRNKYLSVSQKDLAANIYKQLSWLKENFSIENTTRVKTELEQLGMQVEYLEEHWNRIFVAAKIGSTRLIDNISL